MDRITALKSFIQKNPADSFSRHALAMEWVKMGDDVAAEAEMRDLLGLNPDYSGTYYHLGKLLERKGALADAVAVYEKGIIICSQKNELNNLRELKAALSFLQDEY